MNLSFATTTIVKNAMLEADVDFSTDTFKAVMMRDDFSFKTGTHLYLKNIQATTSGCTYYAVASTKTITRSDAGSFVTDGFVVGNYITMASGLNSGETFQLTSVAAKIIKVKTVTNDLVDEGTLGGEVSIEISSNDEHATGGGYTQGTHPAVTWTVTDNVLTLDVIDLGSGGSFGTLPEDGEGFIIYDDTHTSDLVVCHGRFIDWRVNV